MHISSNKKHYNKQNTTTKQQHIKQSRKT